MAMTAVIVIALALAVGMMFSYHHKETASRPRRVNLDRGQALLQIGGRRGRVQIGEEDLDNSSGGNTVGRKLPRTAFCMSGNIRQGHSKASAEKLHEQLRHIDPAGAVFAYINPCEADTQPWWWNVYDHSLKGTAWQDKPCSNPWQDSAFTAAVKPVRMKVYGDADVAPPQRVCNQSANSFVVPWAIGVYQELKGMEQCFRMMEDFEREYAHTFEVVVRVRPDMCKDNWWCSQMTYCSIDDIDRTKVHMHFHFNGTKKGGGPLLYWDSFAIVPRAYAEYYFTTVEDYELCSSFEAYTGHIGKAYGEEALSSRLARGPAPVLAIDNCSCHTYPTITCHGGGTGMM